jgi:hypothetical protein
MVGSLRAASLPNKGANNDLPLGSPAPFVWVFSAPLSPENTVENGLHLSKFRFQDGRHTTQ